ncbi:hypothetical protein O1M54_43390 [Streptomyces diastatochromogenes]|nr:hypothetical protein [Streptomyces diastatochromogenes]
MRSSSRSRETVSRVSSSSSTIRQRLSGATGVSALQCGPSRAASASRRWGTPAAGLGGRRTPGGGREVQFVGGGEQDEVAFEGGQAEAADEGVEGCGDQGGGYDGGLGFVAVPRPGGSACGGVVPGLAGGVACAST